jgi:hypothetical protein
VFCSAKRPIPFTHPLADNATRLAFLKFPGILTKKGILGTSILSCLRPIEKVVAAACAGDKKRGSRLGLLASLAKLLIPVGTSFTNFLDIHG